LTSNHINKFIISKHRHFIIIICIEYLFNISNLILHTGFGPINIAHIQDNISNSLS